MVLVASLAAAGMAQAALWNSTAAMKTTRGAAGVLEVDGRLYVIGGVDGWRFLNTSEFTTIQPDGSLAPWQAGPALVEDRGYFGVAAHNGFIYAVGGGNGQNGHNLLRSVERAKIQADGTLGAWQAEKEALNVPRRCSKILVVGDYLYAFGGYGGTFLDSIERARINADGSLGKWELLTDHFITPRYIHTMAHTDKALYAIGGHAEQGGTGMESSEFAIVNGDGSLGSWKASAALKQGRYGLMSVVHEGYVYAMGGLNGATFYDVIERSRINDDGTLGEWQTIAPLPAPFADVGVATYKDWVYVLGGTNRDGYYNNAFYARVADLANAPASTPTSSASAALTPSKPLLMPNEGNVAQIIDGGAYAYIEIDFGDGNREWLATSKTDVAVGDHVRYSRGIFMQNFHSKALNRDFEVIRFVSKVERAKAGEAATPAMPHQ